MITRARRHQKSRTRLSPNQLPPGTQATTAFSIQSTKAQLVFSAPVVVNGLPLEITRQAAGAGAQLPPTAITIISPTTIQLTYAGAVVATDVITIPANVPEIRTTAGGSIAAAVHTF
jgi:hypothetical protein